MGAFMGPGTALHCVNVAVLILVLWYCHFPSVYNYNE